MGLTLEFLLGDVDRILRAYAEEELDLLDEPGVVDDTADLSLHIVPNDLDRLSLCMAHYSNLPPKELRPHLEMQVDEPSHGALTVSEDWAVYAAAVPTESVRPLVEDWFARMANDWDDPDIQVNEDAVKMVEQFLNLCRRATREKRTLVHTWVG